MSKSHSHSKNTGSNIPFLRNTITDDGAFGDIHDEPDITFYTTDFDVGFISGKGSAGAIIIVISKRFNAYGCCFTVVSDGLV